MTDFEVYLSLGGETRIIGHARSNHTRGKETVLFEYADEWLRDADCFELEPDLPVTRGGFAPSAGQAVHSFTLCVTPKTMDTLAASGCFLP